MAVSREFRNKALKPLVTKVKKTKAPQASKKLKPRIKLICVDCFYLFSLAELYLGVSCPHCGKSHIKER